MLARRDLDLPGLGSFSVNRQRRTNGFRIPTFRASPAVSDALAGGEPPWVPLYAAILDEAKRCAAVVPGLGTFTLSLRQRPEGGSVRVLVFRHGYVLKRALDGGGGHPRG